MRFDAAFGEPPRRAAASSTLSEAAVSPEFLLTETHAEPTFNLGTQGSRIDQLTNLSDSFCPDSINHSCEEKGDLNVRRTSLSPLWIGNGSYSHTTGIQLGWRVAPHLFQ
jgi:hypothetical protein